MGEWSDEFTQLELSWDSDNPRLHAEMGRGCRSWLIVKVSAKNGAREGPPQARRSKRISRSRTLLASTFRDTRRIFPDLAEKNFC